MSNQKVLVAGSGKSGIAAARLMLQMGGDVVLYDGNDKLDAEELKEKFEEKDRERLTIVLGELTRTDLLGVELSVISPGIPLDAPFVPVLDEAKIPIWSEIQLAYHVAKGKLIAITGTNGKTTTTALMGEIMKAHFEEVYVCLLYTSELEWGDYYWIETKAPRGFELSSERIGFCVNQETVQSVIYRRAVDQRKKGRIRLIKIDVYKRQVMNRTARFGILTFW